jgi:Na+/melibiose symporter-like transporter
MEEKINFIEPIFQRVENYGKTSYQLLKLKAVDKTAVVVSTLASKGIIIYTLTMFIVIANIGVALWLGQLLGKTYYGFFCVAGFYGVIGIFLSLFMYNRIKERINNSIISELLN